MTQCLSGQGASKSRADYACDDARGLAEPWLCKMPGGSRICQEVKWRGNEKISTVDSFLV